MASETQVLKSETIREFGSLTICALRYCFGKTTYTPSIIVNATKANWSLLSDSDKLVIKRDVAEALQHRNMGMDFDIEMWAVFYEWILIEENKNNETI